jgi:hypothetical protein
VSRHGRRLLWLFPAVALAFGIAANVLLGLIPSDELPREDRLDLIDVLFSIGFVGYAVVGALIAARRPGNPVGWLFCAFGALYPLVATLWSYAMYGVHATDDGLPGQELAAWLFAWSGEAVFCVIVLVLLLFPDGRFLTWRWRWVGTAAIAAGALFAVSIAFDPGPLYTFETFSNPFGVAAAGGVLEVLREIGSVAVTALLVASGVSLVVRFRRSEAGVRRQIKWLAAGAAAAVILVVTFSVLELVAETDRGWGEVVTSTLALLSMSIIPVAVGVAMLRHRLYDVDLVIRRTVVYGALTAVLVGAYLGTVLMLQLALSPLTEQSDLAIAGSTLAVAALVRPLRGRIQELVDRRFFRRRYDAARTLESFGTRVRDEVSLDSLSGDLRAVVSDTMQPAHLSLWLRKAAP